jgi:hypothetical protein
MASITISDKQFDLFIPAGKIQHRFELIAEAMSDELKLLEVGFEIPDRFAAGYRLD